MRGLKDKVVIVSGGATLIGAAIARAFVAEGARVTIADIDTRGGGALASELGECSRFIATDVSRDADIDACVAATLKAFGRIDCLVNVAAAYIDNGPDSPRGDWEKAFAINVFGAAMFLRACRPHMKDGGAVVNFGSTSAGVAQAGRWTYPATKAAVLQLTRSAALDLAADGIRVNAVAPGYVKTALVASLAERGAIDAQAIARRTPMGRMATPEEIAQVIAFLASPLASYITGAVLPVDGGWTALGAPEAALGPLEED